MSIVELVQKLIDNGHSWSSIKDYTFSEVGAFLKVIVRKEATEKAESLSQMWMGNNLSQKGLQEILKDLRNQSTSRKIEEVAQEEVVQNWNSLASAMKGLR